MTKRTESDENAPPGAILRALRQARGWSLRHAAALATTADYQLSYSAIQRIERNQGYTSASLEALASIYGTEVPLLFLPAELAGLADLPASTRQRIFDQVSETAALYRASRR